jgi:hypothetical protein
MTHKPRVLVLASSLALALSAMSASSAVAVEFHSDSSSGNTVITGETNSGLGIGANHIIEAAGSTLTCSVASLTGTMTGKTAGSLTVSAAYSGCHLTVFGFTLPTTVNMGSCAFSFSANGEAAIVTRPGAPKFCSEENITYRASNFVGECDIRIAPQPSLSSVLYTGSSTTTNGDIKFSTGLTGIVGVATGNLCTAGVFTNGAYSQGISTVKGFIDNEGKEGAQTPIWVA